MIRKLILAAFAIVIGLGTITPALAGGSHGNRHFSSGHHGGGHHSFRRHGGGHHGHGAAYALLGFGLGYALYSASRPYYYGSSYRTPYYGSGYGTPYYGSGNYYQPPQYQAPAASGAAPQYSAAQPSQTVQEFPAGTTCLQTREYTTVITIGGEEQEAYGTACLQPDGSWIAGAPKIVPSFD